MIAKRVIDHAEWSVIKDVKRLTKRNLHITDSDRQEKTQPQAKLFRPKEMKNNSYCYWEQSMQENKNKYQEEAICKMKLCYKKYSLLHVKNIERGYYKI